MSAVNRKIKHLVWGTDSDWQKCYVCGCDIHYRSWHAAHIEAKAHGGSGNDINNLRPTCVRCNTQCGKKNLHEFMRAKGYQMPDAMDIDQDDLTVDVVAAFRAKYWIMENRKLREINFATTTHTQKEIALLLRRDKLVEKINKLDSMYYFILRSQHPAHVKQAITQFEADFILLNIEQDYQKLMPTLEAAVSYREDRLLM